MKSLAHILPPRPLIGLSLSLSLSHCLTFQICPLRMARGVVFPTCMRIAFAVPSQPSFFAMMGIRDAATQSPAYHADGNAAQYPLDGSRYCDSADCLQAIWPEDIRIAYNYQAGDGGIT